MASKNKKPNKKNWPEDLEAVLNQKLRDTIGYYDAKLSTEREKCLLYYNRELPKPRSIGSSTYISPDVYNSVNMMRAQLLETFASGHEIIKFCPQNAKDVEAARIATEYTEWVLFRQNDGYGIMSDCIHDGLMARVGVVKVYWEKDEQEVTEQFDGLDPTAIEALASQPDIRELKVVEEIGPDGLPLPLSGELTRVIDKSRVMIENIAPEEFGIEPGARKLHNSFCFHRVLKTKAEIEDMGYDVSALDDSNPDSDRWQTEDIETYARLSKLDTGYWPEGSDEYREQDRKWWLYEAYIPMTSNDGRPALFKVVRVGDVILDCEEVDRTPFQVFVPLRQSHMFQGENFASLSIQTQNARTHLTRAVLDHTAITTNPRLLVAKGGLTNPRELLDNRFGGIVNVNDINSVAPMPTAPLNQFIMPIMSMLQDNAEETTGVSQLSQGLNKDAISNQNSSQLVDTLINVSQTRQRVIARNFANEFLAPLFVEIYRLIIENDTGLQQNSIEIAGNFVQINPQTWIERKDADVTMHLSPSDATNEAMQFGAVMSMGAQDPALNMMMTPQNRYNSFVHMLQLNGIKDVNSYITPPQMIPPPKPPAPPPPSPQEIAAYQLEQKQVSIQQYAAETERMKIETDAQVKLANIKIAEMQAEISRLTKLADMHRKDMLAADKIDIDQRETAMLERTPVADATSIISPKP